ncbi:MAG: RecX family transcriptional regulator [Candidatus Daviesbacteria bacterium]|nr:RecX family transcriptional regulator [Candidatus Daviesbacteria bacterium]
MKITQVEPQKKNPHRFNIFIDGEFAFGADEDLVVNRRLVVGKELTTSDVEKLLFEAEVGKLMERMYRWFSLRQHSEKEVRDYFKIKNQQSKIKGKEQISQLTMDALVETLKKKGMINDLEFAKAWVEARRKSKNLGIRALRMELYKKGIDKEIIEEVLSEPFDFAQGEEELAKQALEKKMRVWKNLDHLEFNKKAYEFLARKGFEYEIIKETIENLAGKE